MATAAVRTGTRGAERPEHTLLGRSSPQLSFQQAIEQYQQRNAPSSASYEGLFPYLQGLGFQVERPTRAARDAAGNPLLSSDKVVNAETGEVFDVILDVDGGNPRWGWSNSGYWVNGAPSDTPPGGSATPPHGRNPNNAPATGESMRRGSESSNSYTAARQAAARVRQQARGMGRSATILGGFSAGRPSTRPATLLGGA